MNTVNIPEFTAEASLYETSGHYQSQATRSFGTGTKDNQVYMQKPNSQNTPGGSCYGFTSGTLISPLSMKSCAKKQRVSCMSGIESRHDYIRLDPLLFAKRLVMADELDFQTSLSGQPLGMGPKLLSQRFCPAGVVKQTHPPDTQIPGHGLGMGDLRKRASDHDAVKATQHRGDLLLMAFDKGIHGDNSSQSLLPIRQNSTFNTLVPAMPG